MSMKIAATALSIAVPHSRLIQLDILIDNVAGAR